MNLKEIRHHLDQQGIRLTRSLGQNFMHDAAQVRRLVSAAHVDEGDRVLEIGPGLGPLTEVLLEKCAQVTAVEMDARLVQVLRQRFPEEPHLELIQGDGLEWVRQRTSMDWTQWTVVSNLPYSVASPLLVEWALLPQPPRRLVVTVQKEVGDRICAEPGRGDYGVLTLLLAISLRVVDRWLIPPQCFFPEPGVDSVGLVLERLPQRRVTGPVQEAYIRAVRLGFSQRRKMFHKLLRAAWSPEQISEALSAEGLSQQIRAEKVGPDSFARLAERLCGRGETEPGRDG